MPVIIRIPRAPPFCATDGSIMIQKRRVAFPLAEKTPDIFNAHIRRTASWTLGAFATNTDRLMVFGAGENRPGIHFFLSTIKKWSPASRNNGLSPNTRSIPSSTLNKRGNLSYWCTR